MISVVKIGGNIIDDSHALDNFLASLQQFTTPFVVVHGGGKIASKFGQKLGLEPRMAEGRRITDAETLKIVVMTYAGLINKTIVAKLQKHSINAIGLTGADANLITSVKRQVKDIDYGFVGDIARINDDFLESCFSNNIIPVIASITHDGFGNLLNTNADAIAAAIAASIAKKHDVSLFFCFEKQGVLSDPFDDSSTVPILDEFQYSDMLSSDIISKGMKPKLEYAFSAKKSGVQKVVVCHADDIFTLNFGTSVILRGTDE